MGGKAKQLGLVLQRRNALLGMGQILRKRLLASHSGHPLSGEVRFLNINVYYRESHSPEHELAYLAFRRPFRNLLG